jgi:hypothetical protein
MHFWTVVISAISTLSAIIVLGMGIYNNSASNNKQKGIDQQRMLDLENGRVQNAQNITKQGEKIEKGFNELKDQNSEILRKVEKIQGDINVQGAKFDDLKERFDAHVAGTYRPPKTGG